MLICRQRVPEKRPADAYDKVPLYDKHKTTYSKSDTIFSEELKFRD